MKSETLGEPSSLIMGSANCKKHAHDHDTSKLSFNDFNAAINDAISTIRDDAVVYDDWKTTFEEVIHAESPIHIQAFTQQFFSHHDFCTCRLLSPHELSIQSRCIMFIGELRLVFEKKYGRQNTLRIIAHMTEENMQGILSAKVCQQIH